MYRRYVIAYGCVLATFAMMLLSNLLFLWRAGELMSADEVAAIQQSQPCLYAPALRDATLRYKLAVLRRVQPEIVAVGSSRALQFQSAFFSGSFVNVGSTIKSVETGEGFVEEMLSISKPKALIFTADFWWFNPALREDHLRASINPPATPSLYSPYMLTQPVVWLFERKLSVRDYFDTLWHGRDKDGRCAIGVQALIQREGLLNDGSYSYGSLISGEQASKDARFRDTMARMASDALELTHAQSADQNSLGQFMRIIDKLVAAGVQVIVVIPPVAPSVFTALNDAGSDYHYIKDVRERLSQGLAERRVPFVDLHDPSSIESPDCEFVDGLHGGAVTYARVTRRVQTVIDESNVASLIDGVALNAIIEQSAGLAAIQSSASPIHEVDFLDLGCPKR